MTYANIFDTRFLGLVKIFTSYKYWANENELCRDVDSEERFCLDDHILTRS